MIKEMGKSGRNSTITIFAFALIFLVSGVHAQDGEQLFQQCKACHSVGQGKLLGPDLLDMSQRRDVAWLKSFIKSSQTMVKNGDTQAVDLFGEFNNLVMIDYNLPDADIEAIIKYIDSFSTGGGEVTSAEDSLAAVKNAEYMASIDTDENREKGSQFFSGERNFKNGGAACISCHHVNTLASIQGGLLAADLTKSYTRNGGLAGIKGILEFPPYPAMKDAYQHAALTEDESVKLQVFLMHVDEEDMLSESSISDLMKQGIIGVVILLIIISIVWFKRKKRSVNYQIIKRQRRYL
jgi:mono/diheme cytochrome c family protein